MMTSLVLAVLAASIGGAAPKEADAGVAALPPAIVPRPEEMTLLPGEFPVGDKCVIRLETDDPEVRAIGEALAEYVQTITGQKVSIVAASPHERTRRPDGTILLRLTGEAAPDKDESYSLRITPISVVLEAPKPAGLFWGGQTIRQLLLQSKAERSGEAQQGWALRAMEVQDRPRYRWRGMLLDCGRHFVNKDYVKRYIDLLVLHKMNVLHWHLTEDQGWRIEIKKYPKLTEVGAWRKATRDSEQPRDEQGRYGGFYTQDDVREIVAYAKSRYVTVVPEIEMPGHALAALASYPELSCTGGPLAVGTMWGVIEDVFCAGNDQTFEFLQDVLTEVLELFPSEFIHIGGDECPKARWKACAKCQARIKAEGLKDEDELQSYFIRRIEKFLNERGRRLIGWDEILEGGLAPNATVQSWRGLKGAIAAAQSGHDVVCSPTSHCYLDYSHAAIDLQKIYSFEPTPPELSEEESRHVLGAEGNLWTEHAPRERIDRQVFPRMCALAEVMWSPADRRDWPDFTKRMETHYRRLDAVQVRYYVPPPRCAAADLAFAEVTQVVLENPGEKGRIHYTLDGSEPTPKSPKYEEPLVLKETATVRARVILPGGNASDVIQVAVVKQTPREAVTVEGAVAGLSYAYYEGDWPALPDVKALTAVATGEVATFDSGVRKRGRDYALQFTGFIEAPAEGVYTFWVGADDGARLQIGEQTVVEHLDPRASREERGQIILKAGKHPITVTYHQASGGQRLEVSWAGPGVERAAIAGEALWRGAVEAGGK